MDDALVGYESGPDATVRAAASAWARVDTARAVILVEGVTDQIAIETTAGVLGRDLADAGVVVVPMGGAQAIGRALPEIRQRADGIVVGGLCDAGEERFVRRAVRAAGLGMPDGRADLECMGFFVCVDDLEDELIRAAGRELVERVMDELGDRSSFATLQAQPPWRGAPHTAQVRRFIGAGARRKHRYAAALVRALGPERAPRPLTGVLDHVT